jgi:hypothetical protein
MPIISAIALFVVDAATASLRAAVAAPLFAAPCLSNDTGSYTAYFVPEDIPPVAIGDLNGDGNPDLAVASYYSEKVSVLLGNGDGTFGARTDYRTGNGPNSMAIEDLN